MGTCRLAAVALVTMLSAGHGQSQVTISSNAGLAARVDPHSGSFEVSSTSPPWRFAGRLDGLVSRARAVKGRDGAGTFVEIRFRWTQGAPYRCGLRLYRDHPVVLFATTCEDSLKGSPPAFPVLSSIPSGLNRFEYSETAFCGPPVFLRPGEQADSDHAMTSGPLLLFDDQANACIVSPASGFMVSAITGRGQVLACGVNSGLRSVPKGFSYSTMLVVGQGVNKAWDTWGRAMRELYRVRSPASDADTGLKYLGYWTDNGATYYYHNEPALGYEGTLLALRDRYQKEGIPIRYMQLDSWWYAKGYDAPDGRTEDSVKKAAELPATVWNRFGGVTEYAAPQDLFPGGLGKFHDSLGLPLITHNRWVSRRSPYRANYRISGIGAVDARWWDHIIDGIVSWGVVTYEQDWLDRIYNFSPEFSTTTWAATAFMDGMAAACTRKGLTMQYCMPLPRHILQGATHYPNFTSVRVSDDRFGRSRWKEFLYTSRLARSLHVWPWADVFMSDETANLLLATLSGGIVGIGDRMGAENRSNILQSTRTDGVIVKPDLPLVPVDLSYVQDVQGDGGIRVATTRTDHGGSLSVLYAFAYADTGKNDGGKFEARSVGVTGKSFAYDYFAGTGRRIGPDDTLQLAGGPEAWSYMVIAPIGKSGIALVGDPEKFVTSGRQRVARIRDSRKGLTATLLLARGEDHVTLCGYASRQPGVKVEGGKVEDLEFDPGRGFFRVRCVPVAPVHYRREGGDPVARLIAHLTLTP